MCKLSKKNKKFCYYSLNYLGLPIFICTMINFATVMPLFGMVGWHPMLSNPDFTSMVFYPLRITERLFYSTMMGLILTLACCKSL